MRDSDTENLVSPDDWHWQKDVKDEDDNFFEDGNFSQDDNFFEVFFS